MVLRRAAPMEPGERDKYVLIQQRPVADAVHTSGLPKEDWTTLTQAWMSKDDLQGRERLMADQLSSRYDTRWEMGYRADMDPDLVDVMKLRRLQWQGRTFDIVSAAQIGSRAGVELMTLAAGKVE